MLGSPPGRPDLSVWSSRPMRMLMHTVCESPARRVVLTSTRVIACLIVCYAIGRYTSRRFSPPAIPYSRLANSHNGKLVAPQIRTVSQNSFPKIERLLCSALLASLRVRIAVYSVSKSLLRRAAAPRRLRLPVVVARCQACSHSAQRRH